MSARSEPRVDIGVLNTDYHFLKHFVVKEDYYDDTWNIFADTSSTLAT